MVQQASIADNFFVPDASKLVTEDDTPVDNFASEKQQRFLASSLYSSLRERLFLVAANVGIYNTPNESPIVPDVLLSLDVRKPENWWEKQNRCYMLWQFGKLPEVVIEIVSNPEGDELGSKMRRYEQMRVSYYVVYDPSQQLKGSVLRIYEIRGTRYFETPETWLEQVGLGLTLWEGEFESRHDVWLRWCDKQGNVLLTGDERAEQERLEKEQLSLRAEQAEQRAAAAEQRAQQLAEQLRALGVNIDTLTGMQP